MTKRYSWLSSRRSAARVACVKFSFLSAAIADVLLLSASAARGDVPETWESVASVCTTIWTKAEAKGINDAAETRIDAVNTVGQVYGKAVDDALAELDLFQAAADQADTELTYANPAALLAATQIGLDWTKVNLNDPVAEKKFYSATPEGVRVLGLVDKLADSRSRLQAAQAKVYLALARESLARQAAQQVKTCADDAIAQLNQSTKAAAAQPQTGAATMGPSPTGVWRFVNGKEGMTLSIGGGPKEYIGTVGIDTLGSSTPGTLNIEPQSEGIFAGSMTFGTHADGVKVTVAQDGNSLTLTGNGTGQITFTRQK